MIVFKSYNDTYHEYKIELLNLERLENKKNKIRDKYFKITSSIKNTGNVLTSIVDYDDKYTSYMIELENTNIEAKIEEQKNIINKLKYYLNCMQYHISCLKGIEYQIFYEIIYNNKNISKAIEYVAELNNKEPQTIWKLYYPNIKKELEKFEKNKKIQ